MLQGFIGILFLVRWVQVGCSGLSNNEIDYIAGLPAPPKAIHRPMSVPEILEYLEEGNPNPTYHELCNVSNPQHPPQHFPGEQPTQPSEGVPAEGMGIVTFLKSNPDLDLSGFMEEDDHAMQVDNATPREPIQEPAIIATHPPPAQSPQRTPPPKPAHDPPSRKNNFLAIMDTSIGSMKSYMGRYAYVERGVFVLLEFVTEDEGETLEVIVCFGGRQHERLKQIDSERACKFELKCLLEEDPKWASVVKWIEKTKPSRLCRLSLNVLFDVVSYIDVKPDNHLRYLDTIIQMIVKDASYARIDVSCVYKGGSLSPKSRITIPSSAPGGISQVVTISDTTEPLIASLFKLLPWQDNAAVIFEGVVLLEFKIAFLDPVCLKYFSIIQPFQFGQQKELAGEPLNCSVEHLNIVENMSEPSSYGNLIRLIQATTITLEVSFGMYTAIVRPNLRGFSFTELIVYGLSINQFPKDKRLDNMPISPTFYGLSKGRLKLVKIRMASFDIPSLNKRSKGIKKWLVSEFPPVEHYLFIGIKNEIFDILDARTILQA